MKYWYARPLRSSISGRSTEVLNLMLSPAEQRSVRTTSARPVTRAATGLTLRDIRHRVGRLLSRRWTEAQAVNMLHHFHYSSARSSLRSMGALRSDQVAGVDARIQ